MVQKHPARQSWSKDAIFETLKKFAISEGYRIIEITKSFDSFAPSELSQWMDKSGGWFHRVKHGHDFAANVGKVFSKFGPKGVAQYPWELAKDFCTPHGVPVPGTQWCVKANLVSAKTATNWMSLNIADVFTGGVALYSTYQLKRKSDETGLSTKDVIFASIGIGIKIKAGVATANPILLISAGADSFILIQSFEDAEDAFSKLKELLNSNTAKSVAIGTVVGAGTVTSVTTLVGIFGSASTGTAISTLSGAAATKATLAALGGGAIATGGLGIIGGVVVLGVVGLSSAVFGGYLSHRALVARPTPEVLS